MIGIVSMNFDKWEVSMIKNAIVKRGFKPAIINPAKKIMRISEINKEPVFHSVLGRVERPVLKSGLLILKELELRGERVINGFNAIEYGQNKWYTSMMLEKNGIRHPETVCSYTDNYREILNAVARFKYPIVVKPVSGGRGEGVVRACSYQEAVELIELMNNYRAPYYIQEFVGRSDSRRCQDFRIFVVDSEVIGGMIREAKEHHWKTNICNEGIPKAMKVNDNLMELALLAARSVSADIAGVDIIEGDDGYYVLEVNVCPLFRGIYETTGVNPAEKIADLLCRCE